MILFLYITWVPTILELFTSLPVFLILFSIVSKGKLVSTSTVCFSKDMEYLDTSGSSLLNTLSMALEQPEHVITTSNW